MSLHQKLPKGIDDRITLGKVMKMLGDSGAEGINAETAGQLIGVSRTTSRRYLEYLVASGVIVADLSYRAVGRPERVYRRKVG